MNSENLKVREREVIEKHVQEPPLPRSPVLFKVRVMPVKLRSAHLHQATELFFIC